MAEGGSELPPARIKLLTLGDGSNGKTCLLIRMVRNCFPQMYIRTVFENIVVDVPIEDVNVEVVFLDTVGGRGEDYARLRPLCYPQTDVVLLCTAVNDRDHLINIMEYWIPHLNEWMDNGRLGTSRPPFILVVTKIDLREPPGNALPQTATRLQYPCQLVPQEETKAMAEIFNMHYIETSALTGEGVQECLKLAAKLGVEYLRSGGSKKKKSRFKKAVLRMKSLFGRKQWYE